MKLITSIMGAAIFYLLTSVVACKKDKKEVSPANKPVAFYDFNGDAKDKSMNNNNGIIVDAAPTLDSFGTANAAYSFPGTAYIEIPDNDLLDFSGGEFTISAWIKPESTSGTYVVQKADATSGGGPYTLDIHPGKPRAVIHSLDQTSLALTGKTSIKKNVWQHLAVTYNGHTAYLYYNGELEAQGYINKPLEASTGPLHIGTYKWGFPATCFKGAIDNVRLYNKFLLAEEIKTLYDNYQ
jgi:hypothetical protein